MYSDPSGNVGIGGAMATIAIAGILATLPTPVYATSSPQVLVFKTSMVKWHKYKNDLGSYNLLLHVKTDVLLSPRTKPSDVIIYQEMKGMSRYRTFIGGAYAYYTRSFKNWRRDPTPGYLWWNGSDWKAGVNIETMKLPSKKWKGNKNTFYDAPGLLKLKPASFPVYKGSVDGNGFYKYRTVIATKKGKILKTREWGVRINYSTIMSGTHTFTY